MKKFMILAFATLALSASAFASEDMVLDFAVNSVSNVAPLDLINWKVGDTMDYNMSMMGFPLGTMKKFVAKDEGSALWMQQDISMMGQAQKVEVLIQKSDAKILKILQNGKEVAVPDDKPEIISQEYVEVSVAAGKFESIHIVAKTKEGQMEMWMNPSVTCMDGSLKVIAPSPLGKITMELTKFNKQQ